MLRRSEKKNTENLPQKENFNGKQMLFSTLENRESDTSPIKILFKNSFLSKQHIYPRHEKRSSIQISGENEIDFQWSVPNSSQGDFQNSNDNLSRCDDSQDFNSMENVINTESLSISCSCDSDENKDKIGKYSQGSFFSECLEKSNQNTNNYIARCLSCQQFDVELPNKPEDSVTIEDFNFVKLISKGAFGRVWLVQRKITGEYYAMKIVNFADKMTNNHFKMLKKESEIYKLLKGDMFVSAIFTFSHENFICFVMEYMYGGDLGALLEKEVYFSETVAKYYIAEIIQAVESLHQIGIIHRDLKPDNVLIDRQGHLKLTDFGLSDLGVLIRKELYGKSLLEPLYKEQNFLDKKRSCSELSPLPRLIMRDRFPTQSQINLPETSPMLRNDNRKSNQSKSKTTNMTGTPDYMSPEVIKGLSLKSPAIDWWSVGVILFEFLTGIPPFNDESPEKIFSNILNHKIPWDQCTIGYDEGCISQEAFDLINRLLEKDAKKRIGIKGVWEIQNHKFFRGENQYMLLKIEFLIKI